MTNQEKRDLASALAELASDPSTKLWPARLLMASAVWLEAELGSRTTPEITIACERVKAKGTDDPPDNFRGCVAAWLGELVDGVKRR